MKKLKVFIFILVIATLMSITTPVHAIIGGEDDEGRHPYVGVMLGLADGTPTTACTGTLLSPNVFLTAGHCLNYLDVEIDEVHVWFDESLPYSPLILYLIIPELMEAFPSITGTPLIHPAFPYYDAGLVILDEDVVLEEYGVLPDFGALNALDVNPLNDTTFDVVGYGHQNFLPETSNNYEEWQPKRMVAYPWLKQINSDAVGDIALLLSRNPNSGGIAFIDSGSPNFLAGTNVVAAITSGANQGTFGYSIVYRMDHAYSNWIRLQLN